MNHLNIKINGELLHKIDAVRKPRGFDLEQVVTKALENWLATNDGCQFEQERIESLRRNPNDGARADDWLDAQST